MIPRSADRAGGRTAAAFTAILALTPPRSRAGAARRGRRSSRQARLADGGDVHGATGISRRRTSAKNWGGDLVLVVEELAALRAIGPDDRLFGRPRHPATTCGASSTCAPKYRVPQARSDRGREPAQQPRSPLVASARTLAARRSPPAEPMAGVTSATDMLRPDGDRPMSEARAVRKKRSSSAVAMAWRSGRI